MNFDMVRPTRALVAISAVQLFDSAVSQTTCTNTLAPSSTPVVADGYAVQVIANGFDTPRSLQFDTSGNLLVAQGDGGIVNAKLKDNGGTCLEVESKVDLIPDPVSKELNHGIALSEDGKTLYASSDDTVYSWAYDAEARSVGGEPKVVVTGLVNPDGGHSTRTLLRSNASPDQLVVVRGSGGNLDLNAGDIETGHCQLKAFDMKATPEGGYNFTTEGKLLGWGLRNSVGIAEHSETKEIWTVENSVDNVERGGVDFHQNNPGEELNRHGSIESSEGLNYGYPYCLAAWNVEEVPDNEGFHVGSQFSHDIPDTNKTDEFCAEKTEPRLTFQAHTAPLDIKFNGTDEAFISFHGSWYVMSLIIS